jgi:hypothetical protein
MGGSASLVDLSKEQVAEYLRSIPIIKKNVIDLLLENEIDGASICSVVDLEGLLKEIGIESPLQRTKLAAELLKIKKTNISSEGKEEKEKNLQFEEKKEEGSRNVTKVSYDYKVGGVDHYENRRTENMDAEKTSDDTTDNQQEVLIFSSCLCHWMILFPC